MSVVIGFFGSMFGGMLLGLSALVLVFLPYFLMDEIYDRIVSPEKRTPSGKQKLQTLGMIVGLVVAYYFVQAF